MSKVKKSGCSVFVPPSDKVFSCGPGNNDEKGIEVLVVDTETDRSALIQALVEQAQMKLGEKLVIVHSDHPHDFTKSMRIRKQPQVIQELMDFQFSVPKVKHGNGKYNDIAKNRKRNKKARKQRKSNRR